MIPGKIKKEYRKDAETVFDLIRQIMRMDKRPKLLRRRPDEPGTSAPFGLNSPPPAQKG